jgi:hypothetical protein
MSARLPAFTCEPASRYTGLCNTGSIDESAAVAIVLSVVLSVGLLACLEIGNRLARRSSEKQPELTHEGIGVLEAAVFALLGLLLGFSFAGGTSRLDARRQLIV